MKCSVALLFAGAILLSGCAAGPRWVITPVVDEQYCKVSLEHRVEKDRIVEQAYKHPDKMSPLEMEMLLKELSYIEKAVLFAKPKVLPVFQDKEVARLVPALADALAKASPDQRIRFSSINKGGGLLFAARRETEGVMFIKPEGLLNIAFNLINYEFDSSRVNEVPADLAKREPLKIEKSTTPLITAMPYAKPHKLKNGSPSPMWIVVDIDKLHKAFTAKSRSANQHKPGVPLETKAEATAPDEKPAEKPPQETWADQKKGIEKKLRFLKRLFDEGLINQQEYEIKKSKILEKLGPDESK